MEVNEKLEEVYINLWGPHYLLSLSRNTYMEILMDAKTRKLWILYLRSNDKFVNVFQKWLSIVKAQCNKTMQTLCANDREEFILVELKEFCNRKRIKIKYVVSYMPKKMVLLSEAGEQLSL